MQIVSIGDGLHQRSGPVFVVVFLLGGGGGGGGGGLK